ncbi:hypothetical protein ACLB2K_046420 [Fragaria x ananassa]
MKKPIVSSLLTATLLEIGVLKEMIMIREESGIYILQFKDWRSVVFQQFDVVLAKYDDIHSLPMLDLQQLEVWTTVNGLRMAMRNECALTFLGNDMAEICLEAASVTKDWWAAGTRLGGSFGVRDSG